MWKIDCENFRKVGPFELRDVKPEHETFVAAFSERYGLNVVRENSTFKFISKRPEKKPPQQKPPLRSDGNCLPTLYSIPGHAHFVLGLIKLKSTAIQIVDLTAPSASYG